MRIVRNWSVQVLAIAGFAVSAAAQAEDFRVQAQLAYDKIEVDEVDLDADVLSASGTFFFKPVPTDGVPVGEAAYIARSSYASLGASSLDADGTNADSFAANVGYHFANSIFFARSASSRRMSPEMTIRRGMARWGSCRSTGCSSAMASGCSSPGEICEPPLA